MVMNDRLKKRIIMFYIAGILNAFFGLYVLIEGRTFLPSETATLLVLLCFAFAAVNFYMPRAIRQQWEQNQARLRAAGGGPAGKNDGPK